MINCNKGELNFFGDQRSINYHNAELNKENPIGVVYAMVYIDCGYRVKFTLFGIVLSKI